jgi:hypothetical protein
MPASPSRPLGLKSSWLKTLVLSSRGLPLLSLQWKKDHTVAEIRYHRLPEDPLCEMIVRMPEEAFGTHLERLLACPWKDVLLGDEALYILLFTVRHPDSIKHTYYALNQLALKLPPEEAGRALRYILALDFERTTAYFLDDFPRRTTLAGQESIPAALVLPLLVGCESIPEAERPDFVNLVQSFVGFFNQTNMTTSDFLHDIIGILTKSDAPVPMPLIVYRMLTLARSENFSELLRTVSLYEYLARIGHTIDLGPLASWADLTEAIARLARTLAQDIAGTTDLAALQDRKVLDTFLQVLPDYLLYTQSPRWTEVQKSQLRRCMTAYLQTGSMASLKYSEAWKANLRAMAARQLGSTEAAEAFVTRWTTPQTLFTYDYAADPKLKQEEIDRLEALHAQVDLASLHIAVPEEYQHLISRPFTSTYYDTKRSLAAAGAAIPVEQPFLLLDSLHHAKILFYKEQAEVRYDPTKPDSVFVKGITGLFKEAWVTIAGKDPSDEDLLNLEDMREKIAHMILGLPPSKDIPDLVEAVLERCHLDRRKTPVEVQERLRKRLREAVAHHRRQYKDFYDNILQYKLFRYFHDYPERKALLEQVVGADDYEEFCSARSLLLVTIDREKDANPVLAALIGDKEIAYLRKLLYQYNFQRALKLFDYQVTKQTKGEKPQVHDRIIHYAKLLAHIKSSSQKTSSADARERLEGFVDLLGKKWAAFDQLLKHEGTNRALEYLGAGYTLTTANRDYLIEVARNYLNHESRRIYARIETWDSDRFLDWVTVARTVYEPHVAHQQSCMHPDKIHARTGKTEYLMGYIGSPWVKQVYVGSKDLFDPFDEHNKIRCIVFLTPAVIEGRETLALNVQHPYPLNPTREAWRVLMEGCKRLSETYRMPLLFPDVSTEELQHAAIQTRAKLFTHVTSQRVNILVPRSPDELQQRDDCELANLPGVRDHLFLGETVPASMVTSRYWVIVPEGAGLVDLEKAQDVGLPS